MTPVSSDLSKPRLAAYTGVRADIYELVPPASRRILDLGCSDGSLGKALKAERPDREVFGVEYSPALAERAETVLDRVLQRDLNQPDALQALDGHRFDCVICADVLEHLMNPEALLRRLAPYLTPDASLIVSLPNIRHLSAFVSIFLKGTFPRRQRGIFDDSHWRWFTLSDGSRLLNDAGFVVNRTNYSLRWGDQGGGRANKLLIRSLGPHAHRLGLVRELLSYQFAMRANFAAGSESKPA
jgi:SAM-dependent methyltransferase